LISIVCNYFCSWKNTEHFKKKCMRAYVCMYICVCVHNEKKCKNKNKMEYG
jgi:hypothetical protein